MKINLKNGELISISKEFPMNVLEIQDTLDRLKIPDDKPIVAFSISEYDNMELPYTMCRRKFSADIYRLNLFAERYEQLEEYQKAGFKSVLMKNPDSSIDDMLVMTYGIEGVPVYPANDYADLGEIAVDNEMLPELNDCSDEIIELLDLEKVGKLLAEREEGVLLDGYYCVPSSYEEPDISINIEVPDKRFFRLLAAPSSGDTDQAQWFSLPEDICCLREYAAEWSASPEQMYYPEVESALPNISDTAYHEDNWVEQMIALSKQLAGMPRDRIVKLKAVMEAENIQTFTAVREAIGSLNEYDFDAMVQDESQFGKVYACRVFPTNFDWSVLEKCDMHDFGRELLRRKGGEVTEYGAISGRGEKLYTTLTSAPEIAEEQTEDEVETEDESEGMSMGGML